MPIENPLERDLAGRGMTLCLQAPDGRKFVVRAIVRDAREASGPCENCRSFAPIESFSVVGDRFGMSLVCGGHVSVYGQLPDSQG
jgi:hypothetical protein